MAEDVVRKILSEPDKLTRMQLIRDNLDELSESELITCFESFEFWDFFEDDDRMNSIFGNVFDKVESAFAQVMNSIIQRDGITLLKKSKDKLREKE